MAVTIKSAREIELMRESCKRLGDVFYHLEQMIEPGITTKMIDIEARKLIAGHGCVPNFLNYQGFPAAICTSVNEQVVHGIPSKNVVLKEGDIISLDAGLIYKGYHSDMARSFGVGQMSEEATLLMERTKQSFFEGIKMAQAGNHLYDISNAIDAYISQFGYGIVTALVGHGIGTKLHEDPQIPNFAQKKKGLKICPGMTFAIEPMINAGTGEVDFLDDDWTVVSADHSLSAHYENTILVTPDGEPEILTLI